MGWSGIMEWNGVEWILVEDAFWSFWVILTRLVISGPNLVVCAETNKEVNFATRWRQIHPTSLNIYFVLFLLGGFCKKCLECFYLFFLQM